jgi:hypothetical protein
MTGYVAKTYRRANSGCEATIGLSKGWNLLTAQAVK